MSKYIIILLSFVMNAQTFDFNCNPIYDMSLRNFSFFEANYEVDDIFLIGDKEFTITSIGQRTQWCGYFNEDNVFIGDSTCSIITRGYPQVYVMNINETRELLITFKYNSTNMLGGMQVSWNPTGRIDVDDRYSIWWDAFYNQQVVGGYNRISDWWGARGYTWHLRQELTIKTISEAFNFITNNYDETPGFTDRP